MYADDFLLPTGNLREGRSGAQRADVIVVTKCPPHLPASDQEKIRKKLHPASRQHVFFSAIGYDDKVYSETETIRVDDIRNAEKLLLAGIAKPKPFFDHLKTAGDTVKRFPDHHDFSEKDIAEILHEAAGRKIITTEKDYVRLKGRIKNGQLFFLPIKTVFLAEGQTFNQILNNYVGTNTTNRSIH